jgi:hypothetical protein
MLEELWKSIPDFPDYEISNLGRVKSSYSKNKLLKWNVQKVSKTSDKYKYVFVKLQKNKQSFSRGVASLVLTAFVGPCPDKMEACHNDGNSLNNCIDNLRWDSHLNNMQDCVKHGTYSSPPIYVGEDSPRAKLSWVQIRAIRTREYVVGLNNRLSEEFGVTASTISAIRSNKLWKED